MFVAPRFGATPVGFYTAFQTKRPVDAGVQQTRLQVKESLEDVFGLTEFGFPKNNQGVSSPPAVTVLSNAFSSDEIIYRVRRMPDRNEGTLQERYKFQVYRDQHEDESLSAADVTLGDMIQKSVLKAILEAVADCVLLKKAEIDREFLERTQPDELD